MSWKSCGMHVLPPPNSAALRLHVSTETYVRLLMWLQSECVIRRAWVFGSRLTGRRREPRKNGPPDLDVVVEIAADPDEDTLARMHLRDRVARISTDAEPIHLEFDEPGSFVTQARQQGALIFQR